jgi:LPXTG-site transpeptidase (sortase) family protein
MSGLHIARKRNLHIARWTFLLFMTAAIVIYIYFGIRWYNTGELSPLPLPVAAADDSLSEEKISKQQVNAYTVEPTNPRMIRIPSIGVYEARILQVGVTPNNMLDTPNNINDTGWYSKSAKPGSGAGAVVINGHNGGVTKDGIFARINTLKQGDEVSIERGDGKKFTYEVRDVRDMPLDWVNKTGMKEMMYSVDPSKEGLSLITCSGKWIPKQKVFDRRVLVRATLKN